MSLIVNASGRDTFETLMNYSHTHLHYTADLSQTNEEIDDFNTSDWVSS